MPKRQEKVDASEWVKKLSALRGRSNIELIKTAIALYPQSNEYLDKGIHIADHLLKLDLDNETLSAAIVYPIVQANQLQLNQVTEKLGQIVSKLLEDVMQMQSLGKLQHLQQRDQQQQVENLRKLLLAMVTDVRSILIVLAERLWQLYQVKNSSPEVQRQLAQETFAVYAPLANRIGVWQLKWEIEDFCLRYLQPDDYKSIAKWLARKRDERETYIKRAITILTETLQEAGITEFNVTGRVKHIYSIYCKMKRKNVDIEHVYDISALRVLVNSVEECYNVLGVLHNHWQLVPEEFDDYINHPKPNGYRSIHTVIVGPEDRYIEVQVRTFAMHQESELGVAAHWRYKEGVLHTSSYEAKIALLRQILAWQKEVVNTESDTKLEQPAIDLLADQVYVFTPTGDIIDLPKGSTPLDFAYAIHSEVGHRCRGAKVDGKMVSLTYALQTGERVEILTAKTANPSRDWLNPHLNYLKTPRARSRVAHWFRVKDNAAQANALLQTEPAAQPAPIAEATAPPVIPEIHPHPHEKDIPEVQMLGVSNLLTHIANCCKPLPGDRIVGYITRARGVSIHRFDCSNIVNITTENKARLMEIEWNKQTQTHYYPADLYLRIHDRTGLLRDITTILASEKINILGLQTQKTKDSNEVDLYLTIEIQNRQQLTHALNILHHIPNVIDVRRRV